MPKLNICLWASLSCLFIVVPTCAFAADGAKVAIGYIPSIQDLKRTIGPEECYISNPTVDRGSNIAMQSKLVVTSADANGSSMMSNETSVSAGFAGFKSKIGNTYSNNYAGSIATGEYNLAAAVTTTVNTNIPAKNNLTARGIDLLSSNPVKFLENCGTSGVEAYIAGILTTINITVATTSHSASNSFSNTVSAGWGPDQVSNAFKSAKSSEQDFTKVTIKIKSLGNIKFNQPQNGAKDYDTYISNAMAANEADLRSCQLDRKPDLTACANYITNMSAAVTAAISYAKSAISEPPADSDKRSFGADTLYVFPNGLNLTHNFANTPVTYKDPKVNGSSNTKFTYIAANYDDKTIVDPYAAGTNASTYLKNAIRLIYQLNALSARAQLLASLPEMTTYKEAAVLTNLAGYYANDAAKIYQVSRKCYDAILTKDSSDINECNGSDTKIDVAQGAVSFKLNELPDNVFQLYSKTTPMRGGKQELLFRNTIALQYDVDYLEIATGIYSTQTMIRSANQIGFGLAYYNSLGYSSEFFGGDSKRPTNVEGYLLPNTVVPQLGHDENIYLNYSLPDKVFTGVQWWQPGKDETAISSLSNYKARSLYFIYNGNLLSDPLNPDKADDPNDPENVGEPPLMSGKKGLFNKVIGNGDDQITGDSSAKQNQRLLMLHTNGTYKVPSISDLRKGVLPRISYSFHGVVTTKNSVNKQAEQCFAGVHIPDNMKYPGKGKPAQLPANSTYGSTNTLNSLCNSNPDYALANPYYYYKLVDNKAYGVKNMEQNGALLLIPVKNFFGLTNF